MSIIWLQITAHVIILVALVRLHNLRYGPGWRRKLWRKVLKPGRLNTAVTTQPLLESDASSAPTEFTVSYYCVTPKGSSTRFTRTTRTSQLRGNAHSETAVLAYLKKIHPKCDIEIVDLKVR